MTIQEASRQLCSRLLPIYDKQEASNIAELVMENITGRKRSHRLVHYTEALSERQQTVLEMYIRALLRHQPVQYVLHEAWFDGMCLYVDETVLIPRPETEELVHWVKTDFTPGARTREEPAILDIGTGSGCIPLALKKSMPLAEVRGCDISPAALQVARKNATDQQLEIHFHLLDILSPVVTDPLPLFDIITSNPPYIPLAEKQYMTSRVWQYEPHLALFVDNDNPLVFYSAIADFALSHLKPAGCIYLEIHEERAAAVSELYRQKGFKNIEVKKDLQGKERMVKIST